MKRTPIIPVKWINENHDSDWDGVPNYRDCVWYNPHRHQYSKEDLEICWNCEKKFYRIGTGHCPFCGAFIKRKVFA